MGASGLARSCEVREIVPLLREIPRGRFRVGKVVRDRRRVEAVAALGDGHRHDPDARIGEAADGRRRIVRRVAVIDDRAHDKPVGLAFGRALGQRVEAVLAREQGGLGPLAGVVDDPDAEDAPLGLAAMQAAIEVERHVGAVEIADTEMGDARCDGAPIVSRHGDASWQIGQGGVGQRAHRWFRGRPGYRCVHDGILPARSQWRLFELRVRALSRQGHVVAHGVLDELDRMSRVDVTALARPFERLPCPISSVRPPTAALHQASQPACSETGARRSSASMSGAVPANTDG